MTNEYTNEALYAGLADGTLPEEALVTLRDRLYPIILNEAKLFLKSSLISSLSIEYISNVIRLCQQLILCGIPLININTIDNTAHLS